MRIARRGNLRQTARPGRPRSRPSPVASARGGAASLSCSSARCAAAYRPSTTRSCRAPGTVTSTASAGPPAEVEEDGTHRYALEYELRADASRIAASIA